VSRSVRRMAGSSSRAARSAAREPSAAAAERNALQSTCASRRVTRGRWAEPCGLRGTGRGGRPHGVELEKPLPAHAVEQCVRLADPRAAHLRRARDRPQRGGVRGQVRPQPERIHLIEQLPRARGGRQAAGVRSTVRAAVPFGPQYRSGRSTVRAARGGAHRVELRDVAGASADVEKGVEGDGVRRKPLLVDLGEHRARLGDAGVAPPCEARDDFEQRVERHEVRRHPLLAHQRERPPAVLPAHGARRQPHARAARAQQPARGAAARATLSDAVPCCAALATSSMKVFISRTSGATPAQRRRARMVSAPPRPRARRPPGRAVRAGGRRGRG